MRKNLTKGEILRKKHDIRRIFSSGHRFVRGPLSVYCLVTKLPHSRALFMITHATDSVRRNRGRRILKEVYRENKYLLRVSCDIIIQLKGNPMLPVVRMKEYIVRLFHEFQSTIKE